MNHIKVAVPIVGEEEVAAVREVLLSGHYVSGPRVARFEEEFADFIGVEHAVAVSNGTASIQIALACYGIGPGDEVVVPSMTFFSTATAVLHQNAVPVFCDVDENYCMDPDSLVSVVSERTKAVIPVHLYGYPAQMTRVMEIAEQHDLRVIEDCAQAHGASIDGRLVGSIGDAGSFSFFATKNMTTGEGGIITTNDEEVARQARLIRSHGMVNRNDHTVLGYNYRMTEMEAAMGSVQLERLPELNRRRTEFSERILDAIRDLPWLAVGKTPDNVTHAHFWCTIRFLEDEAGCSVNEFKTHLKEHGIGFRHRYEEPLYRQPMLHNGALYGSGCPTACPHYTGTMDYSEVHMPRAEEFSGMTLGLPNHPGLTDSEVDRVIAAVRSFR